jgi:Ca-activated chloride channel family protein
VLDLEWPLAGLAVLLPLLLRCRPGQGPQLPVEALRVPALARWSGASPASGPLHWPWWLLLGWLLIVLAAMQPMWVHGESRLPRSGRDLMLAVDLSRSMAAVDFTLAGRPVDRLEAAQHVAGDFLERRRGDRVGLILFGERAYIQAPLTFDTAAVRRLLDEAEIGLAGKATAIGDAIGLALKRLREDPATRQRVLVLVTDGENTAGAVGPERAAGLAREFGVRIYTIGIGAGPGQANHLGLFTTGDGVDERTLTAVAETTGGRYFRAQDTEQLREIYAALDALEPGADHSRPLRERTPLQPVLLALALVFWAPTLRSALGGRPRVD